MTPLKVDVLIAQFCYGGNGGVATVLPEFVPWFSDLSRKLHADDRIGRVAHKRYGDVPLTMERNRVVRDAITGQFDVILMLDSDNRPDLELGTNPQAKPFWDSSFEFLYQRLCRGVPTVVCAPYCGPPPDPVRGGEENVYVFHFQDRETDAVQNHYTLEAYTRTHADLMAGIQPCDAGPTGVILYSTSAFELMRFDRRSTSEILADFKSGRLTLEQCEQSLRMQSYFWYEFTDQWQTQKASTEDVTNTREIGMAGQLKHNEPVLFCNWDAWAGHYKPKCVGRPHAVRIENVNAVFRAAVENNIPAAAQVRDVDFSSAIQPDTPESDDEPEHPLPAKDDTFKVPITARLICGHKVHSLGFVTADSDLNALTTLAETLGKRLYRPLKMLEVGSWVGESAIALLGGAPPESEIYCVDTWEGSASDPTSDIAKQESPFEWFVKNCDQFIGTTIKPYRGTSTEVAAALRDPQNLDLIYIDADHKYESVRDDLLAWIPHLSPKGILCGHDYGALFPDVRRAVDDYFELLGIHVSVAPGTSVWFITADEIIQAHHKAEANQ